MKGRNRDWEKLRIGELVNWWRGEKNKDWMDGWIKSSLEWWKD